MTAATLTGRHHSRLRIRRQNRPVPASLADRVLDELVLAERVWSVAGAAGASAAGDAAAAGAGAASGAAGLLGTASVAGCDSTVS